MATDQLSSGAHAIIYARKSTKDGGRSEDSQIESCRVEADDRNWVVRKVFRDNVGASRHSRGDRPDYEAMTAYITSNSPDVLLLWEVSRADRKLRTWLDTVDLCKATGTCIYILKDERLYDPRRANDRRSLILDGLDAEYESDKTSERTRREMAKNAKAGRPHGAVLYGYRREYVNGRLVGQVAHEQESEVVAEIFNRVSMGEACETIARDLSARRILSAGGTRWYGQSLRRLCLNPAYIAKRVHQGEIIGDANWPALVDEETFYACKRILEDPNRRTQFDSRIKYLLSGIVKCDKCGSGLRVRKTSKGRKLTYQCLANWCVTVAADRLEAYVIEQVKSRLVYLSTHHEEDLDQVAAREKAQAEADELKAYLKQFTKDAVSQRLSAAEVSEVVSEVRSQINEAEARAQAANGPVTKLVRVLSTDPSRFDAASTEVKRESIRNMTDYIGVGPMGRGYHDYDVATRIDIEWTETRLMRETAA